MAEKIRPGSSQHQMPIEQPARPKTAPPVQRPLEGRPEPLAHPEPPRQGLLTVPLPTNGARGEKALAERVDARPLEAKELPRPGLGLEHDADFEGFVLVNPEPEQASKRPSAPVIAKQPLVDFIERQTTGVRNLSDFVLKSLLGEPKIVDAQTKALDQAKVADNAQSALKAKAQELAKAKQELADIDRKIPADSRLPRAQSAYGDQINDLAKFYLVRAMTPEQREAEADFIHSRMAVLSDRLNRSKSEPQKQEIRKEVAELESWMKAILADPMDDSRINQAQAIELMKMLMTLQLASGQPIGSVDEHQEADVAGTDLEPPRAEPSPERLAFDDRLEKLRDILHLNSKDLFGAEQEQGAQVLAQGLQDQLAFNPDTSGVAGPDTSSSLQKQAQLLEQNVKKLSDAMLDPADPENNDFLTSAIADYRTDVLGEDVSPLDEEMLDPTTTENQEILSTLLSSYERELGFLSTINQGKSDTSGVAVPDTLSKLQERARILEQYVATLTEALKQPTTAEDKQELSSELATYKHELALLNAVNQGKGDLDKIAAQTDKALIKQRGNADKTVKELERKLEQAQVEADKQAKLQNLRDYQSLSTAMTSMSAQIRDLSRSAKADEAFLNSKGIKTPTETSEVTTRLADSKKKLQELDAAFMATMHTLEVFENQKRMERKGGDPYPETGNLEGVAKWAQGLVTTTGDEMPSKAELMRQYHLAKNGLDSISGAYAEAAQGVASRLYAAASAKDASSLVSNISLDKLKEVMGDFKDFAMKNPIIARELAANLMHTYAILSADGSSTSAQMLSSARGILQRRTAENIATDMLLGTREHLYSTEQPQTLTPEQLAFIDLAERAPYLAAAYVGAQGKNLGGSWAQTVASFIPWVGNSRVVQAVAGASGGAAEVKAQKMAAERISRDQEVIANSMLSGFDALGKGEGVAGAIKAAATYGLVRQTLQIAGTMARDVHEDGGIGGTIASYLKAYGRKWTQSPGSETAKVGTAGVVGATVAGATGIAVVGATSVAAAPIAAAVLAGFGATIATRAAYSKIADWWNPERATMRQLQENKERLAKASEKLPQIYEQSLIQEGHANPEEAKRAADVVGVAVQQLNPKVFEDAAKITGKTPQEQQEQQTAFILAAVNKQVEQQRQTDLKSASKNVTADPQIQSLDRRLASIKGKDASGPETSQPEIKRLLQQTLDALPPAEAADSVETQLRDDITSLKNSRTNITLPQITALRDQIQTMRMRQVESAALEDPNLQARLANVGPSGTSPQTQLAGSLAGKTRV